MFQRFFEGFSQALKDAGAILIICTLVLIFIGAPVLMGVYLQPWFILILFLLYFAFMMLLVEVDVDAARSMFWVGHVFWGIAAITYYVSTDQTFLLDFWTEHKHWIVR